MKNVKFTDQSMGEGKAEGTASAKAYMSEKAL